MSSNSQPAFRSPFTASGSQSLLEEEEPFLPASGGAGLLDVGVASLYPTPESKMDYYSSSLGIPRERFGARQGQIVYRTEDGRLQPVESGFGRGAMSGIGPALPAATGMLGSAIGIPLGPVGIAGAGTLGAAGGQALREALAGTALKSEGLTRMATEGAIDLGANVAGLLIGKGVNRALASDAAKTMRQEISRRGGDVATALSSTLARVNEKYGTNIILTPAEITGAADLRTAQLALASEPRTAETMAEFYAGRGAESGQAARQFIEDVSPVADRDVAGQQLVDVAGEAIAVTRAERSAAARPAYESAFFATELDEAGEVISRSPRMVNISAFDTQLNKLVTEYPFLKSSLRKIKSSYTNRMDQPLEFVQNNIKEALDDVISSTKVKKPKASQKAGELQRVLLETLDEQVPQYASARKLWGDLSDPVTSVQGGSLPRIANKTSKDFYDVGKMFITKDSPTSIARAKEQILKVDGGKEKWNAAVRGGLESIWEQSTRQYKSSVARPEMMEAGAAVDFWAKLKGDKAQLSRMQAALEPEQFKALNNLLDVFAATGKAYNFNSTTNAQALGSDALKRAGKIGSVLKFVTAPYRVFTASSDAIEQGIINANLDALAKVITSPNAVEELVKISKGGGGYYNPRNLMLVSRVLAGTGRYTAGVMESYPDMPIGVDVKPEPSSGALSISPNNTGKFISPF